MTILDRPPPDWKRPSMTLAAKVGAWERRAGGKVNYDHRPPVSERPFDTETNDTIPPANDPDAIEPILEDEHDKRTNGPGGEKRITTAGSDANNRAKRRALTKAQEEFRRKVLERPCGQKRERSGNFPKGRKIQSRGFQRRRMP